MKALSIRQPWAFLIVQGWKDIENRTWQASYRGPVLIHAGQTVDRAILPAVRKELARCGLECPSEFPTGGIVGQAEIVDCVTDSESEWFQGPFGFVLANARPLPFRACKGKLGLFDV